MQRLTNDRGVLGIVVGLTWLLASVTSDAADDEPAGNRARYRLPFDGVERTYRVTLAAAPANDRDWLVSTFVAGAVRVVNQHNKGEFSETWDGLDDNFMPVPAGAYVVKGVYAPAEKWAIDGQFHSLIPDYIASPGDSWAAPQDHRFPVVHGHVFEPIREVVPAPDGTALVLGGYVENWYNPFIVDLTKPVGGGQVIRRFPSAGRAGGSLAAYDGKHAWQIYRNNVYCPTNPAFGTAKNRHRHGITILPLEAGQVPTDLTAVTVGDGTRLYVSVPSVDRIIVLDGATGSILARVDMPGVQAVSAHPAAPHVFALRGSGDQWKVVVASCATDGEAGAWTEHCTLPSAIARPRDLAVDHNGNAYVIDGRVVRKLDGNGRIVATFGKSEALHGTWDPDVMISPNRLNAWRDSDGRGRLIVTTSGAPQRIVEWSTVDGTIVRDWFLAQNGAGGFCMDPEEPTHIYTAALTGPQLIRYAADYDSGAWRVDAIWENMCHRNAETQFPFGFMFPQIVHHDGRKYLCFAGGGYRGRCGWMIYRYLPDRDDWTPSAATIGGKWWHDANGNGRVDGDEFTGECSPYFNGNYWAGKVLPGLVLANINNNWWFYQTKRPEGFDTHGNPIYRDRHVVTVTDPFVDARRQRKGAQLDPLRGGNEVGNKYWNWSDLTGSLEDGLYVASVHKPDGITGYKYDEAGQVCCEWKLTRWQPGPDGVLKMKWRVGRKAFGPARPGEVYAPFHISAPVHGLIGLQDGNGLYHVYTDDGLYVDTLMYDRFRFGQMERGGMFSHSGGCYYGRHYLNKDNGKVYIFMGRASNNIYEVPRWRPGFVQPLDMVDARIELTPTDISVVPRHVVELRHKNGLAVPKERRQK